MATLGLPFYEKSFFPNQREVTLKGGILPQYLLGYLHTNSEGKVLEINPALFKTNDKWEGIELSINQQLFHEALRNTLFGKFFTVHGNNSHYTQHPTLQIKNNK